MASILKATEPKESNIFTQIWIVNKSSGTFADVIYKLKQVYCNVVDSCKKIATNST